ncbi:MAG TPA: hypothetical protein VKE40_19900 [Gemmataceae bacterium]|nr:hypothetical protein [Gemmataceae bacterium]
MTRHSARGRSGLRLEPLESREVPATLVNASTLTYQDVDGDTVRVSFSKAILTPGNVNTVFIFDTGTADSGNSTGQQLRRIDLTGLGATATGVGITTTAARSSATGGDGFAAVGQINATGIDLGAVTIDGDLGRIVAGDDAIATTGLKGLTALSLGRYGTSTGAPDLVTAIQGRLDFLRLKSDLIDARVTIQGGDDGDIGSITIGSSLLGGATDFSGRIDATGDIGPVTIKGDVLGGSGYVTGSIFAFGRIATVTVGGSLRGGTGYFGAEIAANGAMGTVTIGGDVAAGSGPGSATVFTNGKLAGVTIGGSLRGGGGECGRIEATVAMGAVKIAGDVVGGEGYSGAIFTQGTLSAVTIRGSLLGGAGSNSGSIFSDGAMGVVKIGGSVIGGGGVQSGRIGATTTLGGATIGGSLVGGAGGFSGEVYAGGAMGAVSIGRDLVGGSATGIENVWDSGTVIARRIASVTIGGSMIAGVNNTTGPFYDNGAIRAEDDLGPVLIRGNLLGNATNPAIISARGSATPKGTSDIAIASLRVLGRVEYARILAGVDSIGTPANADAQIGAVTVGGDWIASSLAAGVNAGGNGSFGDGDDVKMSGVNVKDEGQVFSKIASLSIGGQVIGTAGGTDHFGIVAENVGAVTIGGLRIPLNSSASKDDVSVGITGDVNVYEV